MTALTTRGYPYPQITDTVDQLAAYFQNLATAIDADVAALALRPRVRVVQGTTQSIAHNSAVPIQFAAADILDPAGWHDPAVNNSRVTPTIAGWYECWGAAALGGRTDYVTQQAWIRTTGTTAQAGAGKPPLSATQINSTDMVPIPTVTVFMNGTTDYIEAMVQHTNGASAAQNSAVSFQLASYLEVALVYVP